MAPFISPDDELPEPLELADFLDCFQMPPPWEEGESKSKKIKLCFYQIERRREMFSYFAAWLSHGPGLHWTSPLFSPLLPPPKEPLTVTPVGQQSHLVCLRTPLRFFNYQGTTSLTLTSEGSDPGPSGRDSRLISMMQKRQENENLHFPQVGDASVRFSQDNPKRPVVPRGVRAYGRSFPPVTMSPSRRVVYIVKTGPV